MIFTNPIFLGYSSSIGYGLLCLALALVLYKLGVPKKITRKVVHILVGFEWVFLYHFFGNQYHFLIVCALFLVLVAVSYKGNLMPMISSDGDNAPGTVYYCLAMCGASAVGIFVPQIMLPLGIGILCTSIGDGFAGVVGQLISKHNPKIYKNKSLFGTITNFVASFGVAMIMSAIFKMGITVWQALAIAALSAMLEVVTGWGLDNITITWGVTALTYMFMYFPGVNNYLVPILVTPLFIAFAISKEALTRGGVIAALIVDAVISVSLGNFGFTLLLSFFAIAVVVDKVKRRFKNSRKSDEEEKGDKRDYMQVLANALIPSVMALGFFLTSHSFFLVGFIASLAEDLADTAASGIGAFAKNTFDPFRMKKCENGLSGGMSWLGTGASLLGSSAIGAIALAFGVIDWRLMLAAIGAGFIGAIFDSFLGSIFQAKYKCSICGKITEKRLHCGNATLKHSGLVLVDNDIVNLMSSLFAAAVGILFTALII